MWSRLDDGSDDTVFSVGGLFFGGGFSPRLQPCRPGRADAEKNLHRKREGNNPPLERDVCVCDQFFLLINIKSAHDLCRVVCDCHLADSDHLK